MDHKLKDKTVCVHHRLGLCRIAACTRVSPGHIRVIGFDVDADKIRKLSMGNDNPNRSFTDNPEDINNVDFITIAVPTPVTSGEKLSYISIKTAMYVWGAPLRLIEDYLFATYY